VGRSGERYLLAGRYARLTEVADLVSRATGRRRPVLVAPLWAAALAAPVAAGFAHLTRGEPLFTPDSVATLRLAHRDIRSDKAAAELGFRSRPLAETVADAVAWFREAGRLP
jgi:dihydroflavonol-4-reductase